MTSVPRKTILVTGATGQQGGALIRSLLSEGNVGGFDIVAITRDPASSGAKKLAAQPHVSVIAGDMDHADAFFDAAIALGGGNPIWGVFSVQTNTDAEEAQGKAMVDAAAARGVAHFVYASNDRGGPERSPHNPTAVKNFAAKFAIEKHLDQVAGRGGTAMTYTILRPVTFLENLSGDIHGRGFARMWEQMGEEKKLQVVSTRDIGWFAAQSFLHPESNRNVAISLAGDELTQREADAIFESVVGYHMPLAPCPVASAVKFFLKGTVGDMFRWFEHEGYGADVSACRTMHPAMLDFRAWIVENKGRWNK